VSWRGSMTCGKQFFLDTRGTIDKFEASVKAVRRHEIIVAPQFSAKRVARAVKVCFLSYPLILRPYSALLHWLLGL